MIHQCPTSKLQRASIVVALLFGLLTVFAGGRVLLGGDPGHVVVQPLLLFNTVMGVAYVMTAMLIRRNPRRGRSAAGVIALLNLAVLGSLFVYSWSGGAVASDSFAAMVLRTVIWTGLFVTTGWVQRHQRADRLHAPQPV